MLNFKLTRLIIKDEALENHLFYLFASGSIRLYLE